MALAAALFLVPLGESCLEKNDVKHFYYHWMMDGSLTVCTRD